MSFIPDLREVPEIPKEIIDSARDGNLVLFIGAGLSRLENLPSWKGMAKAQLEFLREKGVLNFSDLKELNVLDARTQLSVAHELASSAGISLNFTDGLTTSGEGQGVYKSINQIGCVCVTTNYDLLLAPRFNVESDGSQASADPKRIYEKTNFLVSHLNAPGTVIHLHGCILSLKSMVVTTHDYLEHYDDAYVQAFLSDLFAKKTVLFLGYGLSEAEILEHILRRGGARENREERKRFLLQGYYLNQKRMYGHLSAYHQKSFGVHQIGYVRDHLDYKQQEKILDDWKSKIKVMPPPLSGDLDTINQVLDHG